MPSPVSQGDVLAGKYRVERVLGEGGMGIVVAAMHVQLDQRVALKFLLPEGSESEEAVARFMREAKSAVRLRSEHVAKVLDVGRLENGAPYIVMEYLDGHDLSDVLHESGHLPIATAVNYVLQACEAVAEAHAAQIVHRDLKPANLFLTKRNDGTACIKVLDFGISKAIGPAAENLTKTSSVMGTPFYMSPEQMRSSKSVDTRSDIWALGMILYELLTGAVAFKQQTLPELCAAILTDPTPPPRAVRPEIPESLEAAVLRSLAKDPNARFQNLGEFASAIAMFSDGGEQAAGRVSRILGVPSSAVDNTATVVGAPRGSMPSMPGAIRAQTVGPLSVESDPSLGAPKKRGVALFAIGGVALLGLAGTALVLRGKSEPATGAPSANTATTAAPPPVVPDPPASQTAQPAPAVSVAPATSEAPKPVAAPQPKTQVGPAVAKPPPVAKPPGVTDFGGRK